MSEGAKGVVCAMETAEHREPCEDWQVLLSTGLLVVADAATEIADVSHEAHLLNRRVVWPGLRKLVSDLADLACWLLRRGVEFRAVRLTGSVLIAPNIYSDQLLCIVVGEGNGLAVAEIKAKHIEISVKESAFSLVDHVQRFLLICFQGHNSLFKHGLSLSRSALSECSGREQESHGAERANHEFVQLISSLPVRCLGIVPGTVRSPPTSPSCRGCCGAEDGRAGQIAGSILERVPRIAATIGSSPFRGKNHT
jgi:hypothetical protein